MNKQSIGIFKTVSYSMEIITGDTCHYTVIVQPIEYNTRRNLDETYFNDGDVSVKVPL